MSSEYVIRSNSIVFLLKLVENSQETRKPGGCGGGGVVTFSYETVESRLFGNYSDDYGKTFRLY